MAIINNLNGDKVEFTGVSRVWNNTKYDFEEIYFGDKQIFSIWAELESPLPITILAAGEALTDYKLYGNTVGGESVGERTVQLFDIGNAEANKYIDVNTGEVKNVSTGGYMLSDYIDVSDMDAVVMSSTVGANTSGSGGHLNLYDASKNWMRGISTYQASPANTKKVFLADVSNASFVRVDYAADFLLQNSLIGGSTAPTSYIPFGYKLPMVVRSRNLFDGELLNGYYSRIDVLDGDKSIYRSFHIQGLPAGTYTVAWKIPVRLIRVWQNNTMYQNVTENITSYTVNTSDGDIAFSFRDERQNTRWDDSTWVMLISGSTAPDQYIPYYRDEENIYIGSDPLGEDEYVDFGEQKIYRMEGGTLTPTDPPVPIPALPTIQAETVIDYNPSETPAVEPEKMYTKYRKEGF